MKSIIDHEISQASNGQLVSKSRIDSHITSTYYNEVGDTCFGNVNIQEVSIAIVSDIF